MTETPKAVCIISGGMDSTVVAHKMKKDLKMDLHLISFDYGQRHAKELEYAKATAECIQATHEVVDLRCINKLIQGSALTQDDMEVPDGHYAEESMRKTVVPNRNAIMLSIGWAYAVSKGASVLGCGVHAGDHFIYPDCRPPFIYVLEQAFRLGTEGHHNDLNLYTPLLHKDKTDVVRIGTSLGVDFRDTWTCYKGRNKHCGTCGSCTERKESFQLAGVKDPTEYEA